MYEVTIGIYGSGESHNRLRISICSAWLYLKADIVSLAGIPSNKFSDNCQHLPISIPNRTGL
jgi:hypothetical protein